MLLSRKHIKSFQWWLHGCMILFFFTFFISVRSWWLRASSFQCICVDARTVHALYIWNICMRSLCLCMCVCTNLGCKISLCVCVCNIFGNYLLTVSTVVIYSFTAVVDVKLSLSLCVCVCACVREFVFEIESIWRENVVPISLCQ